MMMMTSLSSLWRRGRLLPPTWWHRGSSSPSPCRLFGSSPRHLLPNSQDSRPPSSDPNNHPNNQVNPGPAGTQSPTAEAFYTQRLTSLKYPHFSTNKELRRISIPSFITQFSSIAAGSKLTDADMVTVSGRIVSKRESGAGLVFYDLRQEGEKLQVFASRGNFADPAVFAEVKDTLQIGDIIEVRGIPGRTKLGELSIFPSTARLLAPTLHPIPFKSGLNDQARRVRMRHLDLLVNPESVRRFQIRSKVISRMRKFLDDRGFLEVETPVLFPSVGGAAARPFLTRTNALDAEMSLRISPELQLKQLVIGGLEKVYEIGKQFRNEGIDSTHNPEFTTCEFYQAYVDFESLIEITQEMITDIVRHVNGSLKVKVRVLEKGEPGEGAKPTEGEADEEPELRQVEHEIDFSGPFKVIHFLPEIEEHLGAKLDFPLDAPEAPQRLVKLMAERGISTPEPHTINKLLDHLASLFIEPHCIQPTFLVGHPKTMSPLAKEHPTQEGATSRFELFVAGKELVNAYSELNDPFEQRRRFIQQARDKMAGDVEAHAMDENFCASLEYGLPPTAGWGMGIDRFCMFLSGATHIRDVLFFPMVKQGGGKAAKS